MSEVIKNKVIKEIEDFDINYKTTISHANLDYLFKTIEAQEQQIERLNKQIEEYQKALDETTSEKIELANIIKEVREYVYKWKDIGRYRLLEMLGSEKE